MAKDTKRPRSPKGGSNGGSSLLAGLLVGLILGIAAAVGVALYINRGTNPFTTSNKNVNPASPVATTSAPETRAPEVLRPSSSKEDVIAQIASPAASAPPAQKASEVKLDFYDVLPGMSNQSAKPAKTAEVKKPEASKVASKVAAQPKAAWLQAGAFQDEQDADNLKAKLAMLGIEARIQTQDIPGKGLWHRVRVGPFSTAEEIDKARSQLQGNGIQSALVKAD